VNPKNLKYHREHDWARVEGDTAVFGLTDYAQETLGDIVFIELPEVGAEVSAGAPYAEVESVKAVSDVYAPLSGSVVEVNEDQLPMFPDPDSESEDKMSTPSVGRIVHYVAYGTPGGEYPAGVHRAAIITHVHDEMRVSLCVLNPTGLFFNQGCKRDDAGEKPGTWHWPEYVPDNSERDPDK